MRGLALGCVIIKAQMPLVPDSIYKSKKREKTSTENKPLICTLSHRGFTLLELMFIDSWLFLLL